MATSQPAADHGSKGGAEANLPAMKLSDLWWLGLMVAQAAAGRSVVGQRRPCSGLVR